MLKLYELTHDIEEKFEQTHGICDGNYEKK